MVTAEAKGKGRSVLVSPVVLETSVKSNVLAIYGRVQQLATIAGSTKANGVSTVSEVLTNASMDIENIIY
ncbi:MAG: hypothetical protein QOF06_1941 [Solirubrobacterales bacterium]|jgi:hypothetical protein|nr:hypothetical protein [Solirubrobacterales bacterium]